VFVEIPHVPVVCNVLWPSAERARTAPLVDIRLAFCPHCAHIFNPEFDPARLNYDETYENSLHFSPHFQHYIEELARDLVARYDLHRKTLVEIGGGKGDFLQLLCALGDNQGVSIDPSYAPNPADGPVDRRVRFIQDYYGEQYAGLSADFICSRHTLEHIPQPVALMATIRRTIGEGWQSVVFFEAPNATSTLHDLAVWDIIYEHCSYFTDHSLAYLFAHCGFAVQRIQAAYAGQFLCIEATPAATAREERDPAAVNAIAADVARFAERYQQKVASERARLEAWRAAGKRVALWGAGSKGITFLNVLGPYGQIDYAVDINPRKHGMYVTGAGQLIVPPAYLQQAPPDIVLVMNPVYCKEIRQILDELGVAAELTPAF
jgi:hypothetical protein